MSQRPGSWGTPAPAGFAERESGWMPELATNTRRYQPVGIPQQVCAPSPHSPLNHHHLISHWLSSLLSLALSLSLSLIAAELTYFAVGRLAATQAPAGHSAPYGFNPNTQRPSNTNTSFETLGVGQPPVSPTWPPPPSYTSVQMRRVSSEIQVSTRRQGAAE
jgi:hypothetical protein